MIYVRLHLLHIIPNRIPYSENFGSKKVQRNPSVEKIGGKNFGDLNNIRQSFYCMVSKDNDKVSTHQLSSVVSV